MMPTPLQQYQHLTRQQIVVMQRSIELALERARLLDDMHKSGMTYAQISTVTGISRARIGQMIQEARRRAKRS
jgi:uncharacterized protein YerC